MPDVNNGQSWYIIERGAVGRRFLDMTTLTTDRLETLRIQSRRDTLDQVVFRPLRLLEVSVEKLGGKRVRVKILRTVRNLQQEKEMNP